MVDYLLWSVHIHSQIQNRGRTKHTSAMSKHNHPKYKLVIMGKSFIYFNKTLSIAHTRAAILMHFEYCVHLIFIWAILLVTY